MARFPMPRLAITIGVVSVLCLLLHSVTAYPTPELVRNAAEVAGLELRERGTSHAIATSIDLSERPDADPLEQRDNQMP